LFRITECKRCPLVEKTKERNDSSSLFRKPNSDEITAVWDMLVLQYAKIHPPDFSGFAVAPAVAGVAGVCPVGGVDAAHGVGRASAAGERLGSTFAGDDAIGHSGRRPGDWPDAPTAA